MKSRGRTAGPRSGWSASLSWRKTRSLTFLTDRPQSWYANGQLHLQQSYRDGLPDGVFEEWYDDGKSRYRVEFLLGQPVGDWAFWYQNGQKQAEGKVQAGFVKENWTFWNLDGSAPRHPTFGIGSVASRR